MFRYSKELQSYFQGKIKVGCSRYQNHTDIQLSVCKVFMRSDAQVCVVGVYWTEQQWAGL